MLPGMVAKPLAAIVGAGNFGSALALALRRAGSVDQLSAGMWIR